jgi:uncharacterized membrane-anchored protein
MSHTLHLGDYQGVPFLFAAFACVLVAEQVLPVHSTFFYWVAIILLRTAATNLADLGTLQFELDYWTIIAGLSVMLAGIVAVAHMIGPASAGRKNTHASGIPPTTATYWLGMLAAATLGTALGDFGAHLLTLRVFVLLSVGAFLATFWLVRGLRSANAGYWVAIVIFRCAGTNVGDLIAFRRGLNWGLPRSSLVTGAIFLAFVVISDWSTRSARRRSILQSA